MLGLSCEPLPGLQVVVLIARKRGLEYGSVLVSVALVNDVDPDLWNFVCNKGWSESVNNFAQCFLDGTEPTNADGRAGALATEVALALLESLKKKLPVDFTLGLQ